MDSIRDRRRHEWIDQIIKNLELEAVSVDFFDDHNDQKLQYLAKRSSVLAFELHDAENSSSVDSSLEFKARKRMKQLRDSIVVLN